MAPCDRNLRHRCAPSGWCENGCGVRASEEEMARGQEAAPDFRFVDITEPRRGGDDL